MVNVFHPHQHIIVDQPTGDVNVVAGGMPGIPGIQGPPGGVTKEELDLAVAPKANKTTVRNDIADSLGIVTGWAADSIGGRNLALRQNLESNSDHQQARKTDEVFFTGEPIYYGFKLTSATPPIRLSQTFTIEPGETYTVSLWVKGANLSSGMNANILLYDVPARKSLASASSTGGGAEWQRISGTYHNNTNEMKSNVELYFYLNRNPGEETWYTSPKFEHGIKPTDWTPAPEDVVAQAKSTGLTTPPLLNPIPPIPKPELPLRLDTSAGTRIFAGDTMIYGDTGMRAVLTFDTKGVATYGEIPAGFTTVSGVAGGVWFRRRGEDVDLFIAGLRAASTATQIALPQGFSPSGGAPYPAVGVPNMRGNAMAKIGFSHAYLFTPGGGVSFPDDSGTYRSHITWTTYGTWPTSLPGIPA